MKPKYLKKKKVSGLKWVLISVILPLILVIALMIAFMNAGQEQDMPSDSQTSENDATETTEAIDEMISEETVANVKETLALLEFKNGEIQTPYLTLYFPECFQDYLLIANNSNDPYILEFYAMLPEKTEQRIFDVCMGTGADGNLGVVVTDAGDIPVSMTVYSFVPDDTWNQGEIDTVLAMQEAANELIHGLGISDEAEKNNAPALKDAPEETTIVNFLQIETPYCLLQYPAIWADWLHTEQAEHEDVYRVEFYCSLEGYEQLLMFTVLFGGDEGEQLGVVTNTEGITVPVNILMNAPSKEGLQDEELEILYSMQEALNYLIQQLPLQ